MYTHVASDKAHIRHCVFFAFQLKNASEMTKYVLAEGTVTICKSCYKRFQERDFKKASNF